MAWTWGNSGRDAAHGGTGPRRIGQVRALGCKEGDGTRRPTATRAGGRRAGVGCQVSGVRNQAGRSADAAGAAGAPSGHPGVIGMRGVRPFAAGAGGPVPVGSGAPPRWRAARRWAAGPWPPALAATGWPRWAAAPLTAPPLRGRPDRPRLPGRRCRNRQGPPGPAPRQPAPAGQTRRAGTASPATPAGVTTDAAAAPAAPATAPAARPTPSRVASAHGERWRRGGQKSRPDVTGRPREPCRRRGPPCSLHLDDPVERRLGPLALRVHHAPPRQIQADVHVAR